MWFTTQKAIQVLTSRISTSQAHQCLGVMGEQSQSLFPGLYTLQLALLSIQDIRAHRSPHVSEVSQSKELLVRVSAGNVGSKPQRYF